MWRLFFPLRYFSLHNKEKSRIDLWPTLILATIITAPFVVISDANYFSNDGFLDKIIPLSSALTAFYVAALVAVATFSHPDLDKEITLGAIYVLEKDETGASTKDYLTRRQFACIIFGYLAFISMILSVAGAVIVPTSGVSVPDVHLSITGKEMTVATWRVLNGAAAFILNLAVGHMMVVTGLGLYYLMERMHDRQPVVLTKKRQRETTPPDGPTTTR